MLSSVLKVAQVFKSYGPSKSAVIEATGFLVLGIGLYLSLAVFTFDPIDYVNGNYNLERPSNMAGPLGAWAAFQMLHYYGLIGAFWPMVVSVWGLAMVLGLVKAPLSKHLFGLILVSVFGSAYLQIQLTYLGFTQPSFGFGGSIGTLLSAPMISNLGFGGGLIASGLLCIVSLVLTRNLRLSSVRDYSMLVLNWFTSGFSYAYKELNKEEKSDEQILKEALREQLQGSRSLAKAGDRKSADAQPKAGAKARKASFKDELTLGSMAAAVANEPTALNAGADSGGEGLEIDFYYNGKTHAKPSARLFTRSSRAKDRSSEFQVMAEKLTRQLAEFKVMGKVTKIVEGPVVTTFEFEPVPGTKVSKVTGLSKDLARLLQAKSLRILAPIPGKKVLGFEVPNQERRMIGFADFVEHRSLRSQKIGLPVAMGLDAFGKVAIEDLATMPHLLVAGSTGSGKSVFMNALIGGLIARHSAKDLRFMMVDPKMVELAAYNDLPHMAMPVITDPANEAKDALMSLVSEMENRFQLMRLVGARNIHGFNEVVKKKRKSQFPKFKGKWQTMPYIVLIIDELADMMMVLGKEAEIPITRLAQKARAAGIHLVIATQRPSAEVVTGLIKANFPTRIAFRVLSGLDSRTILDQNGAEELIGQGDMLFLNAAGLRRMHGAYLSEAEVHKMVRAAKKSS